MTWDRRTLGAYTCDNPRCRVRVTGYLEESPEGWVTKEAVFVGPKGEHVGSHVQHFCAMCKVGLAPTESA